MLGGPRNSVPTSARTERLLTFGLFQPVDVPAVGFSEARTLASRSKRARRSGSSAGGGSDVRLGNSRRISNRFDRYSQG